MAVIFSKTVDGTQYEVRNAGNTVRLYTDGVFHSQYNSRQEITNSIWDLLMLPAFFCQPGTVQRVLVLGVGGGSVLNLLHRHLNPSLLIGVELIPTHLKLAKKYFGITSKVATLYQDDAVNWLQNYTGPKFDLIIDDLFGEKNGEGERAVELDKKWLTLLNKNLNRDGLLVVNFLSRKELMKCAFFEEKAISRQFQSVNTFTLPLYHNVIASFARSSTSSQLLRNHIASHPNNRFRSAVASLACKIRRVRF